MRIYIETTIPSYLTAKKTREIVQIAHQQVTKDWWATERSKHDLYTSLVTIQEAAGGDPSAAQRRLDSLAGIPLLEITPEVEKTTSAIMNSRILPPAAERDAAHVAVATFHELDILLTWNCRHIANATIRKPLQNLIASLGYELPIICTPEELIS